MLFQKRDKITAMIGEETVSEGTFTSEGAARIDGTVNGDVLVTGRLVLGRKAVVNGNILAESVLIGGKVTGNVTVSGRADLLAGSRLLGDLTAQILVIDKGAFFSGQCRMEMEEKAEENKSE